jgi:uncharacterized protein (DUF1330 family)
MSETPVPALLVVKAYCQHSVFQRFVQAARAVAAAHHGHVLCAQPLHQVTALEPGSIPAHVWLAQFPDATARDAAWGALRGAASLLDQGEPPIVLAMSGISADGLGDFIPTAANVPTPPSYLPVAYLLIEGTGTDQERMDKYRDIILPMMRERLAYYIAFELGGNVKVLSGRWSEAIFAISQWSASGHAADFWFSKRYQDEAIPLRTGVGKFSVLMASGE